MSRALGLVFITLAVVSSDGFSAAQTPVMPGVSTPGVSSPGTPGPGKSSPGTSVFPDAAKTLPAGRSVWSSQAGAITGTFVPGFLCGSTTSQTGRPITGTSMGNAVTWTLSLTNCPSVGTWVGHYQTAGIEQQLTVLWTLAMPDSPPGVGSTFTGSAVFVRQQ
jgi:hypothetical protein